jgi:hypothetical protein
MQIAGLSTCVVRARRLLRSALFQAPGFLLFQVDGKAKRGEPSVPVLLSLSLSLALSNKRREGRQVAPERQPIGSSAKHADGRRLKFPRERSGTPI